MRLRLQPSGALSTWRDDGGAAAFYSAATVKVPAEYDRLERLATIDSLLRAVVWTDAYVDPAGKGWLVSAIAPVYRGEFLEAVVGADVTINRIVAGVLNKEIPWQGFLLLVGKSGTLLALPPQGEKLFELKERLFERFYRGESAAGVPGSGLGMSIVKEIMDIHGGRIEIASKPLQGTTVTLWLPRATPRG